MNDGPQKLDDNNVLVPIEKSGKSVYAAIFRMRKARGYTASRVKPTKDELQKYYKDKIAVEPYIKVATLINFAVASSIHAICLRRKARIVAGLGIKPVTKAPEREFRTIVRKWERAQKQGEQGTPEPDFGIQAGEAVSESPQPQKNVVEIEGITEDEYNEAKAMLEKIDDEQDKLQEWIDRAGGDITFREVLERSWYDYENLGWGAIEVLRKGDGAIYSLVHAPSHLVRMTKDQERFIYLKSPTKPVWFKKFGDKRSLNSENGEWAKDKGLQAWPDEKTANELLFFKQYSPLDPYYGVPAWFAALAEILGSTESRDFMLKFFMRRATPTYAVIFAGGSWGNTQLDMIREFFKNDVAHNHQAVLALEVPKGGEIQFKDVTTEPKGAVLVQKYLDSLRDAIVSAHGLFPAIVGVIETAHLGAGTNDAQMNLLKSVEIRPSQETLENILNKNFVWSTPKDIDKLGGLGYDTQMVKLDEIDLYDEKVESDILGRLYSNARFPIMTPNEARKRLRMDPVEEENADDLLITGPQGNIIPLQDAGKETPQGGPETLQPGQDQSGQFPPFTRAEQFGEQNIGSETTPAGDAGLPIESIPYAGTSGVSYG